MGLIWWFWVGGGGVCFFGNREICGLICYGVFVDVFGFLLGLGWWLIIVCFAKERGYFDCSILGGGSFLESILICCWNGLVPGASLLFFANISYSSFCSYNARGIGIRWEVEWVTRIPQWQDNVGTIWQCCHSVETVPNIAYTYNEPTLFVFPFLLFSSTWIFSEI